MVVCPHCGHESVDRFFCGRCHSLLPSAAPEPLPASVQLPDGREVSCAGFQGAFPADFWAHADTRAGNHPARAYAISPGWWGDLAVAIEQRAALRMDGLAPLDVVRVGDGAVVVAHALPAASRPLLDPAFGDELALLNGTLDACRLLERALTPLHQAGLVWLSFDPASLLVSG